MFSKAYSKIFFGSISTSYLTAFGLCAVMVLMCHTLGGNNLVDAVEDLREEEKSSLWVI